MPTRARSILQFIALMMLYFIIYLPTFTLIALSSKDNFMFSEPENYILDKIAIYVYIYYGSALVAYGITKMAAHIIQVSTAIYLPSLTVYTLHSAIIFSARVWPARGMEVNSRKLYFALLFAPVGIALALAAVSALKRRLSKSR